MRLGGGWYGVVAWVGIGVVVVPSAIHPTSRLVRLGQVVVSFGAVVYPLSPVPRRPVVLSSPRRSLFVIVHHLLLFFVAVRHSWSFAVSRLLFWAGVGCTVRHWQLSLRLEPRKEIDKDILQAQTTVVIGVVHPKRAVWRHLLL
jgi:hypothetical protein